MSRVYGLRSDTYSNPVRIFTEDQGTDNTLKPAVVGSIVVRAGNPKGSAPRVG